MSKKYSTLLFDAHQKILGLEFFSKKQKQKKNPIKNNTISEVKKRVYICEQNYVSLECGMCCLRPKTTHCFHSCSCSIKPLVRHNFTSSKGQKYSV